MIMMENNITSRTRIRQADIVRSTAGHDSGQLFVVLRADGEYLFLADGKGRKLESPKRKKRRHAEFVASQEETRLSRKIRGGEKFTNSELRRTLAACRDHIARNAENARSAQDTRNIAAGEANRRDLSQREG